MGVGSCVECGVWNVPRGMECGRWAGWRRRLEWDRKQIMEVVLCYVEINVKIVPTLHDFWSARGLLSRMGVGSCVECGVWNVPRGMECGRWAGRRRRLEWGWKQIMEVVLCDVEINVKIVPTLHDFVYLIATFP
ncbi:hypothetical protein NDU88_007678 [Pleurodeles waltl]|uniref:Uncharacterized protein n=1 Tax=Pleurodeles waltl TaxID=8319 RepID=A0AAV7QMS4_PLEWA|nr:hypothetical protein NDU88_007678 [Pleurodeles waltl]